MKLYLVGGAVRDTLLGRQPKDHDYVAVGATAADVLTAFPEAQAMGKAFPVFMVPGRGEVALARREKKTGPGHGGFEVAFGPEVTLGEDLSRRDLTVNAMAMDDDTGKVIDLFGGRRDLENRVLRHVGGAFLDDPLRVYRLARFAAQLGFSVASETADVASHVTEGELRALSAERVCEEFRKAMKSPYPGHFVTILEAVGALPVHFPELARLRVVPAGKPEHHPEGDSLTHSLMVVDEAVKLGASEVEVASALFHDLGKGTTPEEEWPRHLGHEERGGPLCEELADRLKLPVEYKRAMVFAAENHLRAHVFLEMRSGKQVDLIAAADKSPLKAEGLALVAEADARGRGAVSKDVRVYEAIRRAAVASRGVKARDLIIPAALEGPEIGLFVRRAKAAAVKAAIKAYLGERA